MTASKAGMVERLIVAAALLLVVAAEPSTGGGSSKAAPCPEDRECLRFDGTVARGERFERRFGPGLRFLLEPCEYGWQIVVRDERPDENIARLTPPFHFVPNPRFIEGWHFRNADNTGPNDGSVNAPQEERGFVFSPEVGRTLDYPPTAEQAEPAGRGLLTLTSFELDPPARGEKAWFRKMSFRVELSWPRAWSGAID